MLDIIYLSELFTKERGLPYPPGDDIRLWDFNGKLLYQIQSTNLTVL